jgi:hypothetical protein
VADKFKSGDLARIVVDGLSYSSDGFKMAGGKYSATSLFEFIDLATYPSFNDFLGKETYVDNGSTATVIKYIGRPLRISRDPAWFEYDVYEILVNGNVCQVFKQNLERIKD